MKDNSAAIKLNFLESICWQLDDIYQLLPEEMLSSYERGWQYKDLFEPISLEEKRFIQELAKKYRSWLLVEI